MSRTQVKARRASKRRLEVAAGARFAGFQVGASFCKSVPSNLHATLPLTCRERFPRNDSRVECRNRSRRRESALILRLESKLVRRLTSAATRFMEMDQPSLVRRKFDRVRGIAAMVSRFDDEGERISEDLTTAVAFIVIQRSLVR